jgi:hypothetical protein
VLIACSLVFDGIQDWGLPEIVPCLFLTPESDTVKLDLSLAMNILGETF